MINTVKRMAVILILLSVPAFLFGYDIGVTIDNSTGFTMQTEASLTQADKLSHWFEGNFGEHYSFGYQISYSFSLDRYALFELDLLQFRGEWLNARKSPVLIGLSAGRFHQSEFSGMVFSHPADGFHFGIGLPRVRFGVSAGYLGLLQTPTSTAVLSNSDADTFSVDPQPVFGPLASPRLVETISADFPELFLRQSVSLALIFQQDLRSEAKLIAGGGRVHTQYYGIGLSGPLYSPFFYDAFFYFNSGQTDRGAVTGYLTGIGLDLYLQKALSSKLSAEFVYASGDSDHDSLYEGNGGGLSTAFIPVSAKSLGIAFSPKLTNVFYTSASYSIKPLSSLKGAAANNFNIQVAALPFFRSTPGPVSETGLDADSDALYLGTELNFSLNARPLSDLGLGYTMGFFFPGTAMTNKTARILGRFDLSMSL